MKNTKTAVLFLTVCTLAASVAVFNVPVFRYALERWPLIPTNWWCAEDAGAEILPCRSIEKR